jgi:hypothetical protein
MSSHLHHHPDVHAPSSTWSESRALHVAACYSNPFRWRTRRELANDFRRHMAQSPNVRLHFGELAYGDRPHDVTHPDHAGDLQVRGAHELFHKENLLNVIVRSFPRDWEYGAIIDADFHFTRHDWALEAVHQLQHYDFVQLFSSYTDLSGETLGTGHRSIGLNNSFAFNYHANGFQLPTGFVEGGWAAPSSGGYDDTISSKARRPVGATGGAWAFRRSAFDAVGGLLEKCILGHADWFMAFGLIGQDAPDMRLGGYSEDYREYIRAWQRRAGRLKKNIGYVDGHAIHHFHGPKKRRGYSSRDKILVDHQYEPTHDAFHDWQGVLQLTPEKPGLRDAIRRYFLSRSEDIPHEVP